MHNDKGVKLLKKEDSLDVHALGTHPQECKHGDNWWN